MANPEPGTYFIVCASDPTYQVEGAGWSKASLKDGTQLQLISWGYADGRIWVVSYREDGTMQILNRLVGKSIDAEGENRYATHSDGDNVHIWTDHDGPNQKWVPSETGGTVTVNGTSYPTYYLKLAEENFRMAKYGSGTSESARNIVLRTPNDSSSYQKWAFVPVPKITSGAVYKVVSMYDTRMQLAVFSGWQKQDGNGVGCCTIHDEWNDQKWLLEEQFDNNQSIGWTLTNLEAERFAVVKDAQFKAKQPVIAWSGGSGNKLWNLYTYSDSTVYEGESYPVVAFGANNGNTYALEMNGASTAFIDTWGDGIVQQRWILVPTWGFDARLSAPYDLIAVDTVGSRDAYTSTAAWGASMTFHYVPYWKCADSISTSGGTSFQYHARNRKMSAETSTWGSWGNWSAWNTIGAMRDGDEWWASQTRKLTMTNDYKLAEVEFEVRTCVAVMVDGTASLRYGATDSHVQTCYPIPAVTFSASKLTKDGIEIPLTSTYGCGSTVVTFDSIKVGTSEILDGSFEAVVADGEGKAVIPYSALAMIPASGSTLSLSYSVGTDQKDILLGGQSAASALTYDSSNTSYTPTVTDSNGYIKKVSEKSGYSATAWILVDGRRIDCPKNPDGTFQVAYPFGTAYTVYTAGYDSNGNWYVWSESYPAARGMHAWSWSGGYATLELREGDPITTEDSIDSEHSAYILDSRDFEAVTFAHTKKQHFTAKGAVVNGVTECTRGSFDSLVGTHCTYRSPAGDIVQVAVTNVSREAHKGWTEIDVSMIREG